MMTLWARACDLRFQIPQSSVADPGRGGGKTAGDCVAKESSLVLCPGLPGGLVIPSHGEMRWSAQREPCSAGSQPAHVRG